MDEKEKEVKHRKGNSKVKYEHEMIKGLREAAEGLGKWEGIKTIIPAEIKRRRGGGSGEFKIKVQYRTQDGLKCLAFGPGVVQEVFIVTNCPDRVIERLEDLK